MVKYLVLAFALSSCGGSKDPACAPDGDLAKLEAAFVAEAAVACKGETFDSCEALPAIQVKYDKLRNDWERCRHE